MVPEIRYFLVGSLPVRDIFDVEKKFFSVRKYDSKTGCFISGDEFFGAISHSTSDMEELTKDEFIQQVERLRSRHVKAEGELVVLYDEIRMIVDTLRTEKRRRFTSEEKERLAELTRQSYELFENTIGCTVCGHLKEYD